MICSARLIKGFLLAYYNDWEQSEHRIFVSPLSLLGKLMV